MEDGAVKRRKFLKQVGSVLGASLLSGMACNIKKKKPNILFIMTDQQSASMMSCTGNTWLKTPALDSLASEGVRFDRAYASNPVCLPSRFSLQTSLYPSFVNVRHNGSRFDSNTVDDIVPHAMGHTFRNAGYQTVYGGKIHLPGASQDTTKYGYDYLVRDEREELADACASFLSNRKKEEQPFFMFVSFINPHDICYHALRDYEPNGNFAKRTPPPLDEALKLPKGVSKKEFFENICPPLPANHLPTENESDGIQQLMDIRKYKRYIRNNWPENKWRLHRWAYHRLTEMVDKKIGIVLDALKQSGLEEDTIIVFTSDHGDMDSAHGLEHKTVFYEESTRIPFIFKYKRICKEAFVDETHLVCNGLDLFPTLCDLAGVKAPNHVLGKSLKPILQGKTDIPWRKYLVIENRVGFMITDGRHKYSIDDFGENREMLFDLEKDPGEMKNCAGLEAYKDIRQKLQHELLKDLEYRGITLKTPIV
jgi:arylsulfatase A-like enzyme